MSLFPHEQRSLFGEILDWMLVPLLVIWPMGVVLTFLVAQNIASRPFDRALTQNVHALAQRLQKQAQGLSDNILPQTASAFLYNGEYTDDADQVYYQIKQQTPKGIQLLSGANAIPLPPARLNPYTPGVVQLRDALAFNQDLRVASMWLELPGAPAQPVLIQVGETLNKRKQLTMEILKGVSIPQFFLLPLALFLVWFALNRSVRPLSVLAQTIRQRKPDDLSALQDSTVPQEVAPLVRSINDLLKRLTQSIATQKRFLADAAHQLKTPLAGLRMQADLAQRESNKPADLKKSLSNIARASMHATRTVNQLLCLARAEGGHTVRKHVPVNVPALARELIQESIGPALKKNITLGYESSNEVHCHILGNPVLLKEMLRNLLDNAISYTPADGEVVVRVFTQAAATVVVQVEDNGPGIAQAEREAVFQPFYRCLHSASDGSGLGLTIVQEIVHQHHAHLDLQVPHPQNSKRPGICFSLLFDALVP